MIYYLLRLSTQILITALLTASTLLYAQGTDDNDVFTELSPEEMRNDNPNLEILIKDMNDFGFDFFRRYQAASSSNLLFSPYGLSSSMALIFNGAIDKTQKQIGKALHYKIRLWLINENFSLLADRYTYRPQTMSVDILLSSQSSLWIQKGIAILPEYLAMIESFYSSKIKSTEFALYPEIARSEINTWISTLTKGKISQIFGPKEISKETKSILINSTYLRAKWLNSFDPSVTYGSPFFGEPGATITVPTMIKTAFYSYYSNQNLSILELPYTTRRNVSLKLSMLILLPNETFNLKKIIEDLDSDTFLTYLRLMKPHPIVVSLPRFRIEETLTVNDLYRAMGVTNIFDNQANLTGMSPTPNFNITSVVQRSSFSVDEAGSDAGIAAGVTIQSKSANVIEFPLRFKADHPFAFIVYDRETNAILLMGRVADPNN